MFLRCSEMCRKGWGWHRLRL